MDRAILIIFRTRITTYRVEAGPACVPGLPHAPAPPYCRAWCVRPAILILDEATSALDGSTEREVQEELKHLCLSLKCTVLMIAHHASAIEGMGASRVITLENGVIKACPSPRQALPNQIRASVKRYPRT